jgi:DNA polymerase-1
MQDTIIAFSALPGEARIIVSKEITDAVAAHADLVAHDAKALLHRFGDLPNLHHDVMLYGFLLNADPTACSLAALAEKYLNGRVDTELAARADTIFQLHLTLRPAVETAKLAELYESIDWPTIGVLYKMEKLGVRVDPEQLKALSVRMDAEIVRLSAEIFEISGRTFNINSPQQLGKVLFEDMQLPAPKGPKGKAISTAADVL